MGRANVDGVELEYEVFGPDGGVPLLLVSGHNAQLVGWDSDFVGGFNDRGFRVVVFDNRDSGLASKVTWAAEPDILACAAGDYGTASYTLVDMADDAAGLLDVLGIPSAHIVGVSMGGMIAQWFAIKHPDKTRSLTAIMTATGDREVGVPTPEGLEQLLRPPATTVEESIEAELSGYIALASPGYPTEVDRVRARISRQHRRCWHPDGAARQLAAILASGDWTDQLRSLDVPTLVIHGDSDRTITPDGGEAIARAVPGAELIIVPGMAHDIPTPLWPDIFRAVETLARRADAAA